MGRKTKFTYLEWHWTRHDENLFDADPETIYAYRILVRLLDGCAS